MSLLRTGGLSLKRDICMEPSSEYKHQYRTAAQGVKFFAI
jgi:hypothetical protein